MGQLILCHPYTAQNPYTIAVTSVKVYAIEELCYFLCENLYLVDDWILDAGLCTWLDQEIKMPGLAQILRALLREKASRAEFVETLLMESGYCSGDEVQKVRDILVKMLEMSEKERLKIRADRLLMNRSYAKAFWEYQKLLRQKDKGRMESEESKINGNIYHNIGIIYAKLFLFEEAVECFEQAYALNNNKASYESSLRMKDYLNGNAGMTECEKGQEYLRKCEETASYSEFGEDGCFKELLSDALAAYVNGCER